jgi:hypothetical protein
MDTITESITENGETKVVAQWQHEHIGDLAKKIASLPQNHDELEIVIADLIKRHIHQEKAGVYNNLKHLVEHLDCHKTTEFLEIKEETHKKLEKEWEYGSDHSCATHIMRPKFAEILKTLLKDEIYGMHNGGSLTTSGYTFHKTSVQKTEGMIEPGTRKYEYNNYERYLWCKLYLKHKTETHAYYKDSLEYVTVCESEEGYKYSEHGTFRVAV